MTSSINIALRDLVHGDVHGSSDPGFAQVHQGFNLALQHRPDIVVSALDAPDVATAVRIGAEHQLSVRVQATGHGIGIPMAGGVLVNTAAMRRVTVDPVRRTATVGAGALWQEVIAAAGKHGLATLCGSSPTVGVVGYRLGGGMGPMARTFGSASAASSASARAIRSGMSMALRTSGRFSVTMRTAASSSIKISGVVIGPRTSVPGVR